MERTPHYESYVQILKEELVPAMGCTEPIAIALTICSGMICDGAKPSCAAKNALAVDAGLMGYHMYLHGGRQFVGGEGIIEKDVGRTIDSVGRLAWQGMRQTDEEILDIMVGR